MAGFLDTVVTVNITATTATPTLPGFGIPAVYAYHTHNSDRIRTYFDLTGMVSDGFTTTEPAYLMAQSIVQQSPRPTTFKVIRASNAIQQTFTFQVTDTTTGDSVGLTLQKPNGTTVTAYRTNPGAETAIQIATALATIIAALSGVASATNSGTDTITVTITVAGDMWFPSLVKGGNYTSTTASVTPAADLDAALLADNTWYGISGSWHSSANITAIAAWAETNKKLHGFTTADTNARVSGQGVFNTLKGSSYKYTFGLASATPVTYSGTGWLAKYLVAVPGSFNGAYKSIAGSAVDTWTPTELTALTTNNGNFYISSAGVNITFDGRTSSGQYTDITIGIDALTQNIQLRVATLLTTLPKLEYTRAGISLVRGAVMAGIKDSIDDGFISNESGFEPQVTVPDLANIAPADKTARLLKNVNFTCTARGAINKVTINGVVNV